jgi:hypothetical protein
MSSGCVLELIVSRALDVKDGSLSMSVKVVDR